jgi:hypothetical protein
VCCCLSALSLHSTALRTVHLSGATRSFETLLRAVQSGDSKSCDKDAGGCGKLCPVLHGLEQPPEVFTVSLAWDSAQAGEEEVATTLKARASRSPASLPRPAHLG